MAPRVAPPAVLRQLDGSRRRLCPAHGSAGRRAKIVPLIGGPRPPQASDGRTRRSLVIDQRNGQLGLLVLGARGRRRTISR